MNCKECINNTAKDKEGYISCIIALMNENKVKYNQGKQEFECDKESFCNE